VPLDPSLKLILDNLEAGSGPRLHELAPEQARQFYEAMHVQVEPVQLAVVENRSIPGPESELAVRVYRPEGDAPMPALVYFHGGGWVIGSLDTHDSTCRALAKAAGVLVVSVDYRLAPEHRYPAAVDDCYAALRWVAEHVVELRVDPERIAVGGDSAGGNLSAVMTLMARDRGGPPLAFQLLIYPVTDADFDRDSYRRNAEGYLLERAGMQWFWDHYLPDRERRGEEYASPLRATDLSGLPPALVITAGFDPLLDEGEAYAERLRGAGVDVTCSRYEEMIHGFFSMGSIVEGSRRAVEQAAAALRERLHV
jgi:acetyl esterase